MGRMDNTGVGKETDLHRRTAEVPARWRMADGAASGRRLDLFLGVASRQQCWPVFLAGVAAPTQVETREGCDLRVTSQCHVGFGSLELASTPPHRVGEISTFSLYGPDLINRNNL
jgi:hypothetical protein